MKFAHYLKEQEYGAPKEWQGKFLKYKALKVSQMLRAHPGALSVPVDVLCRLWPANWILCMIQEAVNSSLTCFSCDLGC